MLFKGFAGVEELNKFETHTPQFLTLWTFAFSPFIVLVFFTYFHTDDDGGLCFRIDTGFEVTLWSELAQSVGTWTKCLSLCIKLETAW